MTEQGHNQKRSEGEAVADASELLETMDGDLEEAARMADLFFQTGGEQIQALQTALVDRDRDGMIFNAHKCAGGAAACGFERLAERLHQFEREGQDMDWSRAEVECDDIAQVFEKTKREIEIYFKRKSGGS